MKSILFRTVIALLLLPSIHACAQNAPKDSADVAVSEGVLKLADWAKFDYAGRLAKAKTGDVEAIQALIGFHAVADGVDGLNHGVTCLELIPVVGDEVFASAVPVFKPKLKKLLLDRLILAQGRTRKEALRQSMTHWAPATWAALNDLPAPANPEAEKKKMEAIRAGEGKTDSEEAKTPRLQNTSIKERQ